MYFWNKQYIQIYSKMKDFKEPSSSYTHLSHDAAVGLFFRDMIVWGNIKTLVSRNYS